MNALSPQVQKLRAINEHICEQAGRLRDMIEEIELGRRSEPAAFPGILETVLKLTESAGELGAAAKIAVHFKPAAGYGNHHEQKEP